MDRSDEERRGKLAAASMDVAAARAASESVQRQNKEEDRWTKEAKALMDEMEQFQRDMSTAHLKSIEPLTLVLLSVGLLSVISLLTIGLIELITS